MKKIAICTPIGRAAVPYYSNSLQTTMFQCREGYQIGPVQDVGHANTPRIRNVLVQMALDAGFDTIVFIDDDISWEPDVFWSVIEDPAPICGVAPRRRNNDINRLEFCCNPREKIGDGRWHGKVATAFLKIEASVFRDLEPHTDWFHYAPLKSEANPEGVVRAWFDYDIGSNGDGTRGYIGEDYWFCNFATEHGIEPVIRTDLGVAHWHVLPLTGVVDDYRED